MTLNVQTAISKIVPALQEACGLDSNFEPLKNPDGSTTVPPSSNSFPADFAAAYNDYASDGDVDGAENIGGDPSILEAAIADGSNTPSVISGIADALATYWSTIAIIPSSPAFGGVSVIAVENNASTKTGEFEDAINSTITTIRADVPYQAMIEAVEAVVKDITWFITESQTTGAPITHETNIS